MSAARNRAALLHSEPVLLVDDGDRDLAQVDAFLDQRVRADEDLRSARVVLHGAREQRDVDAELAARLLEREEVLLGERLGRGHERALATRLDRPQERVERDDGLPGTDLALEQALHRRRSREVGVDLLDRALLVLGQLEREQIPVPRGQATRLAERRSLLALAPPAPTSKADLEDEQLLEREPSAAELRVLRSARHVERGKGIGSDRHVVGDSGRHGIGEVARLGQRAPDHLAQLLDGQILGRGIDGREVGGRRGPVEIVRAHVELVAPQMPAQADVRSRRELLREPRLVEPDGRDLPAVVGDARLDDREPSPRAADRRADDLARDRDLLLAGEEVGDPHLLGGGFVPVRAVLEQIGDRPQAELAQPLRHGRADTGKRVDAARQPVGPRKAPRAGPRLRLGGFGERRRCDAAEYRTGSG